MTRPPLVYASNKAHLDAKALLPQECVIEVEIQKAIVRGDVRAGTNGGIVFLHEHRLLARVCRTPGRIRKKPRAWVVLDLKPATRLKRTT